MVLVDVTVNQQFPGAVIEKDFYALLITNFIIYSFLGYFYFSFIGLGETARRIRILIELYHSKNGLTLKEILERYSAEDMLNLRINRLLNNKQVKLENDRYLIANPDMILLSRFAILMKIIVLGRTCEIQEKKQ